jgi:cytochrome c553
LALLALTGVAHAVPDTLAQRALACTACHRAGDSETPDGYVPRIAGKPAGYLLEQLRNFRDGRRPHDGMARLLEVLDDRYLTELAGYFAGLAPSHRAVAASRMDDALATRAQRWIRQGDPAAGTPACSACHGTALTGVAPNVPGLLGLSADYLAAQLGAWRQDQRHARAPDCMARVAKALPAEDVAALARWLAAQPLPADTAPTTTQPPRWPLPCGSIPR